MGSGAVNAIRYVDLGTVAEQFGFRKQWSVPLARPMSVTHVASKYSRLTYIII